MSNRRFEMYEYRAVLVRMRQGDSDRAIARSGLMGRSKVRRFRALADLHGWLESGNPLPGEEECQCRMNNTHLCRSKSYQFEV